MPKDAQNFSTSCRLAPTSTNCGSMPRARADYGYIAATAAFSHRHAELGNQFMYRRSRLLSGERAALASVAAQFVVAVSRAEPPFCSTPRPISRCGSWSGNPNSSPRQPTQRASWNNSSRTRRGFRNCNPKTPRVWKHCSPNSAQPSGDDHFNAGLAYALLEAHGAARASVAKPSVGVRVHPCVQEAAHILRDQALDVPSLAGRVGLSPNRLSRLFRAQICASVTEFRARMALERFAQIYDGRSLSLTDARYRSGLWFLRPISSCV